MSPLTLFAVALGLVGCMSTNESTTPVTGLRIFEQHTGDVAGTFTHGDAGLDFTFRVEGAKLIAIIRSADGRPLIHSTLADGIETTVYLGRVTLRGKPLEERAVVMGDPTTLAELAELPEARLVEPLRDALGRHGVAKDLYAVPRPAGAVRCPAWSWWAHCDASTLVSQL